MKPTPLLLFALAAGAPAQVSPNFALRNGDRVVFYGDSITDARQYTVFAEAYVRTRFPDLDARFVHSGWGGDRVTGGGGGPIDLRLDRDVFAYRPTVITVMLGMNDGGYRAYDPGLADIFAKGYAHIVERLRREAPGARITLIQPSPYDDVTRPAGFPGGYNAVLLRYADAVADLARRQGAAIADLNAPTVAMLQAANEKDPTNAARLIPDRVHPGAAGHLVMAEALLKSWGAPSLVSATQIDAASGRATIDGGRIGRAAKRGDAVEWTSTESALPFPLDLSDPSTALVLASSDFVSALDRQTVTVSGLDPTRSYALSIDGGTPVATLTGAEWAVGTNLATLPTPMLIQSRETLGLVRARTEVHQNRWRNLQVPMSGLTAGQKERDKALKALDDYDRSLDEAARGAAKPKEHRFVLQPVSA